MHPRVAAGFRYGPTAQFDSVIPAALELAAQVGEATGRRGLAVSLTTAKCIADVVGFRPVRCPNGSSIGFPCWRMKVVAEMANGRSAIRAIIGLLFQVGLTGSAWGDWACSRARPSAPMRTRQGCWPPSAAGPAVGRFQWVDFRG